MGACIVQRVSVAAVMLVKDERDIIEYTVTNLLEQGVDRVYVADNLSGDGTYEALNLLQSTLGDDVLRVESDRERAYWQADKTTRLARKAEEDGFDWVVPCDADEFWYCRDGLGVGAWLNNAPKDVYVMGAVIYNHFPTDEDPPHHVNPFERIGWRTYEPQKPLGKVAVRARRDVHIHAGNHGAHYSRSGSYLTGDGLVIAHFSWRSPNQYIRKIRNGIAAYALTDLPEGTGAHWRMWGDDATDEQIRDHFFQHFFKHDPMADMTLVYDPAYEHRRQHVA